MAKKKKILSEAAKEMEEMARFLNTILGLKGTLVN